MIFVPSSCFKPHHPNLALLLRFEIAHDVEWISCCHLLSPSYTSYILYSIYSIYTLNVFRHGIQQDLGCLQLNLLRQVLTLSELSPRPQRCLAVAILFRRLQIFHRFRRKKTHGEFTARCSGWSTTTCLRTYWNICASSFFLCFINLSYLDSDSIRLYPCYNVCPHGHSPGASRLALRCRIRLASHCDSPGYALTFLTKDNLLQDWGIGGSKLRCS